MAKYNVWHIMPNMMKGKIPRDDRQKNTEGALVFYGKLYCHIYQYRLLWVLWFVEVSIAYYGYYGYYLLLLLQYIATACYCYFG